MTAPSMNELFQRAIVKHLGLDALSNGKISPYTIAEMFFKAGYEAAKAENKSSPDQKPITRPAVRFSDAYSWSDTHNSINFASARLALDLADTVDEEMYKAACYHLNASEEIGFSMDDLKSRAKITQYPNGHRIFSIDGKNLVEFYPSVFEIEGANIHFKTPFKRMYRRA